MIFQPIADKSHTGARAALADGRVVRIKASPNSENAINPKDFSSAAAAAASVMVWEDGAAHHETLISTWRVAAGVEQARRIDHAIEHYPADHDTMPLFNLHEDVDRGNLDGLARWAENDELVGLVDESCGGIVGYIKDAATARRLADLLNAAACEPNMKDKLDVLVKAVGESVHFVTPAHQALRDAVNKFIAEWQTANGETKI